MAPSCRSRAAQAAVCQGPATSQCPPIVPTTIGATLYQSSQGRTTSRFLTLPAEVRLRIYKLLSPPHELPATLKNGKEDCNQNTGSSKKFASSKPEVSRRAVLFLTSKNMLLTCSEISKEMSPIFFGTKTFVFTDPTRFANEFLNTLPNYKIHNVRYLEFDAREAVHGKKRCPDQKDPVYCAHERRRWRQVRELFRVHHELRCLRSFRIVYRPLLQAFRFPELGWSGEVWQASWERKDIQRAAHELSSSLCKHALRRFHRIDGSVKCRGRCVYDTDRGNPWKHVCQTLVITLWNPTETPHQSKYVEIRGLRTYSTLEDSNTLLP